MAEKKERVITPLDSKSAVTVFKSISITRSNPREKITSTDLENLLAQALWKSFDQLRSEVAMRLRVEEVDLLLTDARVTGIKVDGHQVPDPEGSMGREIELDLCITVVRRDKLSTDNAIAFEEGSVRAHLTAAMSGNGEIIYVDSGNNLTTVFLVAPERTSYVGEFEWGKDDVVNAFTSNFVVGTEMGNALYLRYAEDNASPRIIKKFEDIFRDSFGTFVNGITMAVRDSIELNMNKTKPKPKHTGKSVLKVKALPPVYVRGFMLPKSVWNKSFMLGDRKIKFIPAPEVDLIKFIDGGENKVYKELNQLAKRRIKWLMPNNE